MKRITLSCFCVLSVIFSPLDLLAADKVTEANKLFDQGGLANYKGAIELYLKALDENPNNYEASWKCARACREYGDEAKKQEIDGWKEICAKYGKLGMRYAQKAIEIQPGKPDGYYYYGLNVGTYSDGVSMFTALSEGLKDKTQSSFEKTYELDKMYNKGGPMISLGRFWAVLPWPMRDRKKSLKYYREYQQTEWFADNTEAQLFIAEVLIQIGGKDNRAEAKGFVEKAMRSEDPYFKDWAEELNTKL